MPWMKKQPPGAPVGGYGRVYRWRKPAPDDPCWDEATWRDSTIPKMKRINKNHAKKFYHLNDKEIDSHLRPDGQHSVKVSKVSYPVKEYEYDEWKVERLAWMKYGGPENFAKFLHEKYVYEGKENFPYPTGYIEAVRTGSLPKPRRSQHHGPPMEPVQGNDNDDEIEDEDDDLGYGDEPMTMVPALLAIPRPSAAIGGPMTPRRTPAKGSRSTTQSTRIAPTASGSSSQPSTSSLRSPTAVSRTPQRRPLARDNQIPSATPSRASTSRLPNRDPTTAYPTPTRTPKQGVSNFGRLDRTPSSSASSSTLFTVTTPTQQRAQQKTNWDFLDLTDPANIPKSPDFVDLTLDED